MNRLAQRRANIRVRANNVSRGRVVANGEVRSEARIDQSTRAGDGGTADLRGPLPDDLGEMAKVVEVAQVDVVCVIGAREVAELAVVHVVGDHHGHLVGRVSRADVLAVAAAVDNGVVGVDA